MAETPKNATPRTKTPSKRQRGGQRDNRNAGRHYLTAGKLPKDCAYLENRLNAFRRSLEDRVIEKRGSISLDDAAHIQSCLRWERHSQLCLRWLRIEGAALRPLERMSYSREIAVASDRRDKALEALRLEEDAVSNAWATLDAESTEGSNEQE